MAPDNIGNIILGGQFTNVGSSSAPGLALWSSLSGFTPVGGSAGVCNNGHINTVTFSTSTNTIYVGGEFDSLTLNNTCNNYSSPNIGAFMFSSGWNGVGSGTAAGCSQGGGGEVIALLYENGTVNLGGYFTGVNPGGTGCVGGSLGYRFLPYQESTGLWWQGGNQLANQAFGTAFYNGTTVHLQLLG